MKICYLNNKKYILKVNDITCKAYVSVVGGSVDPDPGPIPPAEVTYTCKMLIPYLAEDTLSYDETSGVYHIPYKSLLANNDFYLRLDGKTSDDTLVFTKVYGGHSTDYTELTLDERYLEMTNYSNDLRYRNSFDHIEFYPGKLNDSFPFGAWVKICSTSTIGEGFTKGELILMENYSPAGTAFESSAIMDWTKEKFVAKINVANATGTWENILSFGSGLVDWAGAPHFHLYYTRSTGVLRLEAFNSNTKLTLKNVTFGTDVDVLNVEISKTGGVVVNGVSMNADNSGNAVTPETYYSTIWELAQPKYGAKQGSNLSDCTYEFIKVVPIS